MTDDTRFGDWLAFQLKRRRMTQTEFAELVGTKQSVVSRWVRNERIPDPDSCDRIADALRVDLDDVLLRAGHRPMVADDPENVRELIAMLRRVRLNPERESLLRGILASMAEVDRQAAAPDRRPEVA